MSDSENPLWTAPPRPDWLSAVNQEGSYFDLPAVVPLDEASLLNHACQSTGLDNFGDEQWREPFSVLIKALEEEAELTLMGRLMARSDIILWLSTRLQVTSLLQRHPEILEEEITAPMVIAGLPYSEPGLMRSRSGGTPYGASHWGGEDNSREVDEVEASLCKALGNRVARLISGGSR